MRVLIISPHFPPSNAADMHRVRMLLPYFREYGIEAEVLAVESDQVAAPRDPWLEEILPGDIRIHRVEALGLRWCKFPGLGTLSLRALGALRRRGDTLLAEASFDLVFFSTTQFGVHTLGPEWKERFGVPFVMDYQDPWVSDYYRDHPEVTPPGGRLKYALARQLSLRQEPKALRACAGITSVSASYPRQLEERYAGEIEGKFGKEATDDVFDCEVIRFKQWNHFLPFLVLPFPGDRRDLELASDAGSKFPVAGFETSLCHWVYVGRGGKDMHRALRGLFGALAKVPHEKRSNLRLHFIGTSYAAAGRGVKTIESVAAEYGLLDIMHESPDRISYRETLNALNTADVLMVPGSDDPAYTASKIYPYLLAEKPLVAVFHEESSVVNLFETVRGGNCISFADITSDLELAERIEEKLGVSFPEIPHVRLRREALEPFLAPSQAKRLAEFFRCCLGVAL